MNGTDATTGKALSGIEHLYQSIRDILTTPIGTRTMLRDYGSRLFELADSPINETTKMEIYVATVEALTKWEPRIQVTKVTVQSVIAGRITLSLDGNYLPDGQQITMDGLVI